MRKLLIVSAMVVGLFLAGCQSGSGGGGGGGYITHVHHGYGSQSPIVLQYTA